MQTLVALTRGVSPRISECELTFIERQVIDYPRAVQQHRQYQQFLIDSNWQIQQINPGSGTIAYSCSVGVAPDGRPQVTWYQERTANDLNYLHFKYAILQDGRWLTKTIDFDAQTGKWQQMLLDSAGHPHIAYDAFVKGEMRYAYSRTRKSKSLLPCSGWRAGRRWPRSAEAWGSASVGSTSGRSIMPVWAGRAPECELPWPPWNHPVAQFRY